jgi:hypothetical protein
MSARVQGTIISAVVGGTASVLGGGKFANGAYTGAFSYLFNNLGKRGVQYAAKGSKLLAEEMAGYGFEPTPGKSTEITFVSDSGVRIRIDGVFAKDGMILFGEAKIGDTADLTKNQRSGAFSQLEKGQGRFVGDGAQDLRRALGVEASKDGSFRVPSAKILGVYIATFERSTPLTRKMIDLNSVVRGASGGVVGRGIH